jgi:hypothetical protein
MVDKVAIEVARQKLIAATLGHQDEERYRKKAAVRQLIGTLVAARKRGLSFDRMAELLGESGVEIASETLRGYYFELKTEAELSAEHGKHAKQLAKIQQEIADTDLADDVQFAIQTASEYHTQRATGRVRVNAFESKGITAVAPAQRRGSPSLVPTMRKQPVKAVAPVMRAAAAVIVQSTASMPTGLGKVETSPKEGRVFVQGGGALEEARPKVAVQELHSDVVPRGRTIDEIAADSVGKTAADLTENIQVRDNCVLYSSGKPFEGFLGAKQIHLLRTVGKVIAPTTGRSSGDFVSMALTL